MKAYEDTTEKMKSEGLKMNDSFMLSYKDFKLNYNKKRKAYEKDQENGKYKYTPDAVKDLVTDQQYNLGYKEARGFQRLLKINKDEMINKNFNFKEFRNMGREDIIEYFDEMNYWEKAKAIAHSEGKTISQTFFGSK